MADIYSPWAAGSEEDVTTMGLVTPEYMEMYAEAQAGPGSEAEMEMETEPEVEDSEPEAEMPEVSDPMKEHMSMAMETMQQQANVISKLMTMLTGS